MEGVRVPLDKEKDKEGRGTVDKIYPAYHRVYHSNPT